MQSNDSNQGTTRTPIFDEGKAGLGQDDTQSTVSPYTSHTAQPNDRMEINMLNELYRLPVDNEQEWERLTTQHRAVRIALGGLYPTPETVRAVLNPQEGVTKEYWTSVSALLSTGCGSGVW
ncbi:hypothetical protein M408DRAFT_332186 [Serendipita vermifera MAFF 305830]|uniref:Uncharacterized protein n=1 Tax=Serendipita vermifera MAFF 305830 TaxID=933852 RepID=A0A0C2WBA7_SERVB|nr:hypothetical protein M408DRAFT_332186 [Serendipita vermifera MAFF 305830]